MPAVTLVQPGPLDTRTGGTTYNRRVVEGLRGLGWTVDVCELDHSFPDPTAAARAHAGRAFAALPPGRLTLVDSLALGVIPEIVEPHEARLRLVGLVHLPRAADPALDDRRARDAAVTEQRALRAMTRVVVTGRSAVALLDTYGLPRSRIVVIEPGTARAPLAAGSRGPDVQLICVATLNAGKGHEDLLHALAAVPRGWRLTCAGSLTRDPHTAERVRATVDRLGLGDRVTLAGELNEAALDSCYHQSDVFVLATKRETYGMAVAEALARGLPVIGTRTGAIPDLVGDSAGAVVDPGDRRALADVLTSVIGNASLRQRYAEGARRVRDTLPEWQTTTSMMARVLDEAAGG